MAVTALTLYLPWASLAFGWRYQRRRTGDGGLRLQAQPNTPHWWAKIGFAVAMPIGIAAPITVIGILLIGAAQHSMGDSGESTSTPTNAPNSSTGRSGSHGTDHQHHARHRDRYVWKRS